MTQNPFISLIIPVYNVEKYVEQCIISCLSQDIPLIDYELILVNDGSTDRSLDIITKFAESYLNISVVSQENQGLSVARNVGVEQARGNYIWFIDSDDWIESNCLASIIAILKSAKPDILITNYVSVYSNGQEHRFDPHQKPTYLNSQIVYQGNEYLKMGIYYIMAWSCIINRTYWIEHCFQFVPKLLHEDEELMPKVYLEALKIKYYDSYVYYYRKNRVGSIMSNISEERIVSCLAIAKSLFFYAESKCSNMQSYLFYRRASLHIERCYTLICNSVNDKKLYSILNDFLLKNPRILLSYKKSKDLRLYITYIIYVFFPCLSYVKKFKIKTILFLYGSRMMRLFR